jgi:hypothetical protein
MAGNVLKRGNIHPAVRVALVSILILCGGSLAVSIYWIFKKINHSAGVELAEVAVAFLSVFVLALILMGMRAGLGLDRWIRNRRFEECRLFHSSKHPLRALSWLGYGHLVLEGKATSEELDGWNVEELLALFEKPKRGGRRPTHSPELWIRVVLAWENRDLLRDTLTLAEFLSQEFGTNADGTPRESESNFYDYRKKILKQIKKKAGRK